MNDPPGAPPEDISPFERLARHAYGAARPVDDRGSDPLVDAWLATTDSAASHVRLPDPPDDPPVEVVDPAPPDVDPAEFPRYDIEGEIARGGMGVVLKAHDRELGRDVAIKILAERLARSPALVRRFVDEARIGGQLQHPGIVPVLEAGRRGERGPYFTMKLVKGRTLADLLRERTDVTADRHRFFDAFETVCQAVAYAHARRVVHRDLKPANVMVGAYGEVQVMDWGLARVLTDGDAAPDARSPGPGAGPPPRDPASALHSRAGSVMGTPGYMPPEQARGDVDVVDERADVFALGAILLEILTGRPAHHGADEKEIRRRASAGALDEARARLEASGADPELEAIVRACLEPSPSDRPRHAEAVAVAFSAYRAAAEERARAARIAAERATARAAAERRVRRRTVVAAAATLLAVGATAGTYLWRENERRVRRDHLELRVEEARDETVRALEAARHRPPGDVAAWTAAAEAARRMIALADDELVGPDKRARATRLETEVENGIAAARTAARQSERDRTLLHELETLRGLLGEHLDLSRLDADYERTFRAWGLEPAHLDPGWVAERLGSPAMRAAVATAVQVWALARARARPDDPLTPDLQALALTLDPDPWRKRLREALFAGDTDRLRAMAAEPGVKALDAASRILLANALFSAGDAPAAVALGRESRRRFPGDFWTHLELGAYFRHLDPPQLEAAAASFRTALALRPTSYAAAYNLSIVLQRQGRTEEAAHAAQHAVEQAPGNAVAWVRRAWVARNAGDLKTADHAVRRALAIRPRGRRVLTALGELQLARGENTAAADTFRRATRLFPDAETPWYGLGRALLASNDPDGAVAAFQKAIAANPAYAETHEELGLALKRTGNTEEAERHFREAIRLNPRLPAPRVNLGILLRQRGRVEDALAAYREAARVAPDFALVHREIGSLMLRRNDPRAAVEAYERALHVNPRDPETLCDLGLALMQSGRYAEALDRVRKGHELGRQRANWRYPSARWVQICEQRTRVATRLERLIDAGETPASPKERVGLALICLERGLFHRAAEWYRSSFVEAPHLAKRRSPNHRFLAARAAALAGAGEGRDAGGLDGETRSRWRGQAVAWLEAELAVWTEALDRHLSHAPATVRGALVAWWGTPDLAAIRDPDRLAALAPAEKKACDALWTRAAAIRARCRE